MMMMMMAVVVVLSCRLAAAVCNVPIVDGAPEDDSEESCKSFLPDWGAGDNLAANALDEAAGVRCCNDAGDVQSMCHYDCELVTFAEAERRCANAGMRVCGYEEVISGSTAGTGCYYDKTFVWAPMPDEQPCVDLPTASPTFGEPELPETCEVTLVDGSPYDDSEISCKNYVSDWEQDDVQVASAHEPVGGVRCCGDDGTVVSMCYFDCELVTFGEAYQRCANAGMRVCSYDEVRFGHTVGMGCYYDKTFVWAPRADVPCVPTASPTMSAAPTVSPTPGPTPFPSPAPSSLPHPAPTPRPSPSPSTLPNPQPTSLPSDFPTTLPNPSPTVLPSSSPTSMPTSECVAVVDGSPGNERRRCKNSPFHIRYDADIIYTNPYHAVAGTRCCDDVGGAFTTFSICDQVCDLVDFATAKTRCEEHGARLCTVDEISSGKASGTGCRYDFLHVWSNERGDCPDLPYYTLYHDDPVPEEDGQGPISPAAGEVSSEPDYSYYY